MLQVCIGQFKCGSRANLPVTFAFYVPLTSLFKARYVFVRYEIFPIDVVYTKSTIVLLIYGTLKYGRSILRFRIILVTPCLRNILKKEVVHFFEKMLYNYKVTRRHIPVDREFIL
jgi:hypothetical protein